MNADKPRREARKSQMPPLKRLEGAISSGRRGAFDRALADCLASSTAGQWQQRALRLVMDAPPDKGGRYFLEQLLGCPSPPRPNPKENFLGVAVLDARKAWVVEPLIDAGFQLKDSEVDGFSPMRRMAWLACTGSVGGYERLLAVAMSTHHFQAGLATHVPAAVFNGHPGETIGNLLDPGTAKTFVRAFLQLGQARAGEVSQNLGQALGEALAIRSGQTGDGAMLDTAPWLEGYTILREAGAIDPACLDAGISRVKQGPGPGLARELVHRIESEIAAGNLHEGTIGVGSNKPVARI